MLCDRLFVAFVDQVVKPFLINGFLPDHTLEHGTWCMPSPEARHRVLLGKLAIGAVRSFFHFLPFKLNIQDGFAVWSLFDSDLHSSSSPTDMLENIQQAT